MVGIGVCRRICSRAPLPQRRDGRGDWWRREFDSGLSLCAGICRPENITILPTGRTACSSLIRSPAANKINTTIIIVISHTISIAGSRLTWDRGLSTHFHTHGQILGSFFAFAAAVVSVRKAKRVPCTANWRDRQRRLGARLYARALWR